MPKSKTIKEKDKKYLWHPFTQMTAWVGGNPLIIKEGKGSYLYDTDGNKYLDGISSLWVIVHGHRKKELDQAVKDQLGKVAHTTLLGLGNVPSIELAEQLIKLMPKGLDKVFYSDSGSTAVEIALKIAFQASGKKKFITLKNAYHGDTIGSVSVGGMDLFHKIYKPLLFKAWKVSTDLAEIERVMIKYHKQTAAMIVEPLIQGAAGMLLQPPKFLKNIRHLCRKYGILLIFDEVATGFGRTGKMFAMEHDGVVPDILCLAKGITGGYLPLAATITSQEVFDAFGEETFFHGHTYTGNPLACAAALANLKIFKKEKTLQKLQPKIKLLSKRLKEFEKLPQVKEARQCGFMVGIELKKDNAQQVILEARKRGAILRPLGKVIVLMPPLSISKAELSKLLDITHHSITSAA
ncbi:MAG: adenosylmethionine--8-amino-7-oxononanoate transaminase [Candidatus Margulisiibacteriota bacterium]